MTSWTPGEIRRAGDRLWRAAESVGFWYSHPRGAGASGCFWILEQPWEGGEAPTKFSLTQIAVRWKPRFYRSFEGAAMAARCLDAVPSLD